MTRESRFDARRRFLRRSLAALAGGSAFFAAPRSRLGPPMSMFSTASSNETPSRAMVCSNG